MSKHKRAMHVGSVKRSHRKIRGQRREVFVKKVSRKKYLVRLTKPRVPRSRLNYGRAHKIDHKEFNRGQDYERRYFPKRKTSIIN